MSLKQRRSPLDTRRAGILLHPTSLPGARASGDLGSEAYHFVDWLAEAGVTVWQMLPLGPTHDSGSPYQCLSVYAGNPSLISLHRLCEQGFLPREDAPDDSPDGRRQRLRRAYAAFQQNASAPAREAYQAFVAHHGNWLGDYSLYVALRQEQNHAGWADWPQPLRDRDPAALSEARRRLAGEIELTRFEQFTFFSQWNSLREYANGKGILLFGDMPIFVAFDSADVWAHREYFELDQEGHPQVVAGVPPDYFSETGQRWGNPLYNWKRMEQDGFAWWLQRLRSQLEFFDLLRVDHFRGFEAYWEIPAGQETAINGRWVKAPGDSLFKTILHELGSLPIVAEDLGLITHEVTKLRDDYALPGMKVLQFAFDGGPSNPYLPHHHEENMVVYTGTHDNDTTVGWYDALDDAGRECVLDYLGRPGEPMPWPLIRSALASIGRLAVLPMQDVLELGSDHRMNMPGTVEGNWRWRFQWEQVPADLAHRVSHLVELYGRAIDGGADN